MFLVTFVIFTQVPKSLRLSVLLRVGIWIYPKRGSHLNGLVLLIPTGLFHPYFTTPFGNEVNISLEYLPLQEPPSLFLVFQGLRVIYPSQAHPGLVLVTLDSSPG